MSATFPALSATRLGVRELTDLIVAARAAGDSDANIAQKVSRVEMKERLTEGALADIRAGLGPKTAEVIELLADQSEFLDLPAVETPGAAPPTRGEQDAVLAKARDFAANSIHNLPNFICTRVIRRFDDRPTRRTNTGPVLGALHLQDTITSEVSFDHGKESYAAQTVDGQTHEQPMRGLTTWGEFGGILEALLVGGASPKTECNRWELIDGKRVAVFLYSVDGHHSRYTVTWRSTRNHRQQVVPGYRGELFIDPASGSVVRLTRHAVLPKGFPMKAVHTMVEYRAVFIAGNSYLCPVKSVTLSLWEARSGGGVFSLSEVRFSSYHKFGASSALLASNVAPEAGLEATDPPRPVVVPPRTPVSFEAAVASGASTDSRPPPPMSSQANSGVPNGGPSHAGGSILRVTTRLVDVSALVLDKHGNPITDLKKEDFEIYDEGKRQSIRLFSAAAASLPGSMESPPAGPPPVSHSPLVYSNRVEESSRSNAITIILVDEGGATWEELAFARSRIVRFLRQIQPGDRIGLYTLYGGGIGVLHEFTRDSADLVSSLEAWYRRTASQMDVVMAGSFDAGSQRPDAHRKDEICLATPSLNAIAASADHVAGIPGRKNLIWISGGSSPSVLALGAPAIPQNCFEEEMKALRAVNRANVALYSIDFRGLETLQPDASVSQKDLGMDPLRPSDAGDAHQVTMALSALTQTKLDSIEKDQSIVRDVAYRTGGRAFTNTNDILGALRTAFGESHATYSLGFYPESPRFDGRYRQIEVKVHGRPDLTVRYRRGYIDARESPDPEGQLREAVESPLDASAIALTAERIGYDVRLNIGVGDLDLQQDDRGRWQGRIHVVLAQKDEVGQQLDNLDDTLQLELKPDRYEAMRKSGLAYHRAFQPNPKAASLRVVVRDEAGNLGSVTIPLTAPGR